MATCIISMAYNEKHLCYLKELSGIFYLAHTITLLGH